MLSYEHFRQQQISQQPFDLETSSVESYPTTTMEYNYNTTAFNNNLAFLWGDLPVASYTDASVENFEYEMARTPSSTSLKPHDFPPALLSSGSIPSACSSPAGSPHSGHVNMAPIQENYCPTQIFMQNPEIVCDDGLQQEYGSGYDLSFGEQENKLTVPYASLDPHLLASSADSIFNQQHYVNSTAYPQPPYSGYSNSSAPSPVPSQQSHSGFNPSVTVDQFSHEARLQRGTSVSSRRSVASPRTSISSDEENTEKRRCPHPDCARIFKDLKAHMLTHQTERPEKCPIVTCDYHIKGFARKYDKNRHTLTHYKGTMVCGFCPGSGSAAEHSFNRADVFKRHFTSVHKVEQNPPNSRKRSPSGSIKKLSSYCLDATGKCSTCPATFNNAQEFYDHIDDCVLRIVQQEEPSEAINAQRLSEVSSDPALHETFDRNNMIKLEEIPTFDFEDDEEEDVDDDDNDNNNNNNNNDDDDDDEDDNEVSNDRYGRGVLKTSKLSGNRAVLAGHISKSKPGRKGTTWSKGGVPLAGKNRKRRKHYPLSWGLPAEKMKMKRRKLCIYDGPRRLDKDDMMLDNEFEVRMKLPDSDRYITDLDIETLNRAEAFHNATEEEKGPWIPDEENGPWIPDQDFLPDFM